MTIKSQWGVLTQTKAGGPWKCYNCPRFWRAPSPLLITKCAACHHPCSLPLRWVCSGWGILPLHLCPAGTKAHQLLELPKWEHGNTWGLPETSHVVPACVSSTNKEQETLSQTPLATRLRASGCGWCRWGRPFTRSLRERLWVTAEALPCLPHHLPGPPSIVQILLHGSQGPHPQYSTLPTTPAGRKWCTCLMTEGNLSWKRSSPGPLGHVPTLNQPQESTKAEPLPVPPWVSWSPDTSGACGVRQPLCFKGFEGPVCRYSHGSDSASMNDLA